jgi:succinylarginine dihydrolase
MELYIAVCRMAILFLLQWISKMYRDNLVNFKLAAQVLLKHSKVDPQALHQLLPAENDIVIPVNPGTDMLHLLSHTVTAIPCR